MRADKISLGVNIDHIAVLREARKINDPDPVMALGICAMNGADQITIHLREDRRHIHDHDAERIIQQSTLPVNLECSINPEIIDIVCRLKPHRATLVPENRNEVTTEGGLDVVRLKNELKPIIQRLHANGIEVSLFIDPVPEVIEVSHQLNADWIELHTGTYANVYAMLYSSLPYSHHRIEDLDLSRNELSTKLTVAVNFLKDASSTAHKLGLKVAAGHGLNYQNVSTIVKIPEIIELNIGQSIIARSVFTGLANAIKDMKELCSR